MLMGFLSWLGLTCLRTEEYERLVNDLAKAQDDNYGLKQEQNVVEPSKLSTISIKEVYELLSPLAPIFISDEVFNTTSQEEASKFSQETRVQYDKWTNENHDCDQFSFALMGYWSRGLYSFAFGIAWSGTHAFNIMIDDKKQIWIVEPQTNKWMKLEEAKVNSTYYPIRVIMM